MTLETISVASVSDAYLHLLAKRGVDFLFANAGTDFAPIIESLARSGSGQENRAPQAVPITHENVAVGMAHGYYLVTGRPQAVMLHVNVGTANGLCALMNAARENVPILLTAGRTPLTDGKRPGARSAPIHWAQEMFDQAGMLREMVKWDYELRNGEQIETVVDRALSIAMSEPKGPVYLTLPREVLGDPLNDFSYHVPSRMPANTPPVPAQDTWGEVAGLISKAKKPLIIAGASGRHHSIVKSLGDFAARFAIPVVEYWSSYLCLPTDHPMHLGFESAPHAQEADLILMLDCDVPWIPAQTDLSNDCKIIHIATDPLFSRYPIRNFSCDIGIASPSWLALPSLHEALEKMLPESAVRERRALIKERHDRLRAKAAEAVDNSRMTMTYVSACVDAAKEDTSIVVNEYPLRRAQMSFSEPGTFFDQCSSAGLGFGLPAALGIKLAAPERDVIVATGDGSYLFGNPVACHHTASSLNLPILTIVCNNQGWGAVERATRSMYPDGNAAAKNRVPLSTISSAPDYEKIVEACGGYGERVDDPSDLPAALRRALTVVRTEGRQALLNVICE